ncbi:MAG TPA: alpha/beta fold hydrolase [Isosphaeraceae bacterium]|nr:alpha/beta fold hydrolase [Isosphaeraceae bacterium]
MRTTSGPVCRSSVVPPFEPHPLLRGGHVQTVAGRYLPGKTTRLQATYHELGLEGGDRLSLLDSVPVGWRSGDPAALLVHGLAGCARSPYVIRLAEWLVRLGARVVRMNLRGAGSGFGLARETYHSGRTEDVRAVAEWLAARAPGSPIALVGFSLGANLALKLAAEAAECPVTGLDCVVAANPPLDLAVCCEHLQRGPNRHYDRHFLRLLRKDVARLHAAFPDLGPVDLSRARSLYEFDDLYTAPRNGFVSAADYYARASAAPLVPRITLPGLVLHARDDPFIPPEPFEQVVFPCQLALELIPYGGHLGYVSRTPWQGDYRWLDVRLTTWLADRWSAHTSDRAGAVRDQRNGDGDRVASEILQGGVTTHG